MKKILATIAVLALMMSGIAVSDEAVSISGCGRMPEGCNSVCAGNGGRCEYADADADGICDNAGQNNCNMRSENSCGMRSVNGCGRMAQCRMHCGIRSCAMR